MFSLGVFASDAEYKLLQTLLKKYDVNNRPVENASHTLQVTMRVALHQIIDLVSPIKEMFNCLPNRTCYV